MSNDHQKVMKMLSEVPGVLEHMKKPSVIKGKQIFKRRMELNLTQQDVIRVAQLKGLSLTQATLSRAESGYEGITIGTYDKIIQALGGVEDIQIKFKEYPKQALIKA